MTSPAALDFPFVIDPDFNIWLPALHPTQLEGRDLTLEQWADKMAGSSWAKDVTPDPVDYERVRRLLMLVGSQDFPGSVPWQDKWIHFPDRDDMPLAVMISDNDVQDDGSDDELRAYLRVDDPLLIEAPIVEEVHTAMGRGLRALAYSPMHEEGKVNICATLAYVWRVEWPDGDISIVRLFTMEDPTRVLKATDDIHALAMTLRLRQE
ncbi:MAG: hypothetical protein QOF35_466 [Actinomycetota bacterium]|jgi:hypothetical protein|nr:hypothetical protein [Actinomycetota bacterium]